MIQLPGQADHRAYPFTGDRSDATPRQVPSSTGDKNLIKKGGNALKVVLIERYITMTLGVHIYNYGWILILIGYKTSISKDKKKKQILIGHNKLA